MARSTITVITSDISGEKAEETLTFGLSGRHYSIDLTTAEANELRSVIEPYAEKAEALNLKSVRKNYQDPKSGRSKKASTGSSARISTTAETSEDRVLLRQWARENGYSIGDRGRISEEIRDAYADAH